MIIIKIWLFGPLLASLKALLGICDTIYVKLSSDTSILEEDKKGHTFLSALQSCQDSLPACVQDLFLHSTMMIEENFVFCQCFRLRLCNTGLKNCHLTCSCFEEIHAEIKH